MNPVELSIFSSKISSVADEMGVVLQRSAFSPNIRDRLDFSCALFSPNAELCAQAAHIPVHLGSMAYAMSSVVEMHEWRPGDTMVFNDPYLGGTHLPDVTMVSPVFVSEQLCGFVANRAHHANIGSESPGSMPISSSLQEEGMILEPQLLEDDGVLVDANWQKIIDQLGHGNETTGDFLAQLSANRKGVERLSALASAIGRRRFLEGLGELNDYGEDLARSIYEQIPDGLYSAQDFMDDDGQGNEAIQLKVSVRINGSSVELDFDGSSPQVKGNINCPLSVAAAGAFYVFRCLLPSYAPACAGIFRPIKILAPVGSLVNAERPAAVAAGNVETSSRIVDLVVSAMSQAIPEKMPAAAQGTMNNVAMGYRGDDNQPSWNYYETIGGGMGASAELDGLSGVQSHMTNTFNTPVEVLESNFPLRVHQYSIREGSGGSGEFYGGNGLVREYEFLHPAQATLLTERRKFAPQGIAGGGSAARGKNLLNGQELSSKCEISLAAGDKLRIETPGGGGFGVARENKTD